MPRSVFLVLSLWAIRVPQGRTAEIGSEIGNFTLQDISGTAHSLQHYSGKIVILVFWSFKCPVSLAYDDRMKTLQDKYGDQKVVVLGVASAANESPAEIRANAANLNLEVPVLLDSEGDLAKELGASHTPSVFIIDSARALRYKGALDNNKKEREGGRTAYAEDAIDAILAGRPVPVPETKPFGCSIKMRGIKE